jgi:peptidylprolyl isomerase
MKWKRIKGKIAILAITILVVAAVFTIYSMSSKSQSKAIQVILVTTMGNITIQLYNDMPITAGNFKRLVEQGVYNETIFHRVIAGFVIQGGDPTGTGAGDPSIPTIQDEFSNHNRNDRGTVAMAKKSLQDGHAQPNSASSQFYINLANNNNLDAEYSVFGKVIEGMDNVVDEIAKVETSGSPNFRPLQNVTVIRAILVN